MRNALFPQHMRHWRPARGSCVCWVSARLRQSESITHPRHLPGLLVPIERHWLFIERIRILLYQMPSGMISAGEWELIEKFLLFMRPIFKMARLTNERRDEQNQGGMFNYASAIARIHATRNTVTRNINRQATRTNGCGCTKRATARNRSLAILATY
jgi:hypothetical protein